LGVVAHGRRDGNKSFSKGQRRRTKPRPSTDDMGGDGAMGAWWVDEDEAAPSTSAAQTLPPIQRPAREPRRQRDTEESEEDGRGWWEIESEKNLQAYAPGQLEDWQVKRLEQAYAVGRKKVKIMELANELDLDRAYILHWFKEFGFKPDAERNAIIAQRHSEMHAAAAKEKVKAAAQAAESKVPEHPKGQEGFIPFYTRKEMGMIDPKKKRLSADVLRTLESIYNRTAFPSDEIIRGLWDLHKLNRDTALQWFMARREQDGIASSEQKRRAKETLSLSSASPKEVGPLGYDDNNMLVRLGLGDAVPQPENQEPKVVTVTRREMAMIKSALPSPNKFKGKKLNEEMGVTSGDNMLQVGNTKYVLEPEQSRARKWSAGWRHRRASAKGTILPLALPDEAPADS